MKTTLERIDVNEQSPMARSVAESLEGFRPLVIGNIVFVPKLNTSLAELVEASYILEPELIGDHPSSPDYWMVECPE